jgi:hypothetical protein
MEKLKSSFRKNGIDYKLLDRTALAALFAQKLPTGELAGYEVCKIHIMKACILYGKNYPESEIIPSNEQFGHDDSKAFFPPDLERARQYLKEFTLQLQLKKVVYSQML